MTPRRVQVVVPCFNEAVRFDSEAFARALANDGELSFVLVDDGSADDTASVLHTLADRYAGRVEVLELSVNSGKAEAVRQGMLAAFAGGAELAGYWDADLATPLDAIADFVAVLKRSDRPWR
jgi:GT2 family glycosyltransferase